VPLRLTFVSSKVVIRIVVFVIKCGKQHLPISNMSLCALTIVTRHDVLIEV